MKKKLEKTLAMSVLLALGSTGCVFAAPTAEDTDARIAALEQQQQELAKELKALKSENKKLKNQSNSQKKQIKGMKSSVNEALNRFSLHGFGRLSWDNDNIKGYIDRNDNRRFYMDLQGKFKVNDKWNFNFESETNPRYANSVMADGTIKSHTGHDDEDGVIQRVWAEGDIGQVHVDAGRRWRGLGFQNVLFGNESDGVVLSTPIPNSKLRASAFYLSPTDEGYDVSLSGLGISGTVGHGLQINCAIVRNSEGRNHSIGTNVYDKTSTFKLEGTDITIKDLSGSLKGGGTFHGYLGKKDGHDWEQTGYGEFNDVDGSTPLTIYGGSMLGKADISGKLQQTDSYSTYQNTMGSYGFVLSAMWNPLKNIFIIGDYARTNAKSYVVGEWGANGYAETKYDKKACTALRLNYRWSNINDPGSFQIYGRYFDYARNVNGLVGMFGDKEWGLLQPGSHGWVIGCKYVPAKNIEWETMYEYATAQNTLYGHKNEAYHRHFLRTQVDYHF